MSATNPVKLEVMARETREHGEVLTCEGGNAGDALARGMLAGMCANNIDQAKRMLAIGNVTMCEFELHKALEKIMPIKKL